MRCANILWILAVTLIELPVRAADLVVLKDGDRFSGTLQRLENGNLYFRTPFAQQPLEIAWELVATLVTDGDVTLTGKDGDETGRLLASPQNLRFQRTSGGEETLPPSSVLAIRPKSIELEKTGERSLSVSIDFGQSYSGLAHYNQLSSNSDWQFQHRSWDASLVTHFDYYGTTEGAGATYQAYGRFVGQRYLGNDRFFLFPYLFLGRQTTSEGKGQIRQVGGGAGWTVHRHKPDQVSFYFGLVRSNGNGYTVTEGERTSTRIADTLAVAAVCWERLLKNRIETNVRLYYFKPLGHSAMHSMATDASAKLPLFGPAYFTVRAYDTPELRQKHLFSRKNLQLSSGIGVEF